MSDQRKELIPSQPPTETYGSEGEHILKRDDRLCNLALINVPELRKQAAREIKEAGLKSLSNNSGISITALSNEEIAGNPKLTEEYFGRVHPTGSLVGLFSLHEVLNPEVSFTIGVFNQGDNRLIVHRSRSPSWVMNFDASQATVVGVVAAIENYPHAEIQISGVPRSPISKEEIMDLLCLGFQADTLTTSRGCLAPAGPTLILSGVNK